jgi:hypothetical protein
VTLFKAYFGQPINNIFDIINVVTDCNCGFSVAQILLEYNGTIPTAIPL